MPQAIRMNILGISAFYHDSAACLVQDGRIVAAAQEERFTRKKHDADFPRNAAEYCAKAGGISLSDLDYVVFYDKPLLKFDRLLETYVGYSPSGFKQFKIALPVWLKQKLYTPRELDRGLGGAYKGRYLFTEHHEAHAASAFNTLCAPGRFSVTGNDGPPSGRCSVKRVRAPSARMSLARRSAAAAIPYVSTRRCVSRARSATSGSSMQSTATP